MVAALSFDGGRWGSMGVGRGRWGSSVWAVTCSRAGLREGAGQCGVGIPACPRRPAQTGMSAPPWRRSRHHLAIAVGSYGSTGSTGGLEDEDEDEKALACDTSSRTLSRFRQSVGTKRGDKVWRQGGGFDLHGILSVHFWGEAIFLERALFTTGCSSINVTSMTNTNDNNHEPCIMNFIDHAVYSDSDSPSRPPGKFNTSDVAWGRSERPNSGDDAGLGAAVNPGKLLLGNTQDSDRIVHAL